MCCFTGPVKEVSGTKIFARAGEGAAQFIVYEMRVKVTQPVAMVLPLPVDQSKGEKAVRFIDLSNYAEFFDALHLAFVTPSKGGRGFAGMGGGRAMLEVQKVGAYDASYVPTVKDFSRLDERFRLPNKVRQQLPQYKDWGFAVFKLREGELKYHPMAFSFDRQGEGALFFPTVHIHDGKVHPNADFDHMLYCQPGYAGLELKGWTESQGPLSRYMELKDAKGIVDGFLHCYRYGIKGRRKNRDIYVLKS